MEVFKNDHCTLNYSEKDNLLTQVWKDFASLENFRNAIDFTISFVQTHHVSHILTDTTKQKIISKECTDYAQSKMPILLRSGLKKMAFVLSESALNGMAVIKFAEKVRTDHVDYFSNIYQAKKWLLQ